MYLDHVVRLLPNLVHNAKTIEYLQASALNAVCLTHSCLRAPSINHSSLDPAPWHPQSCHEPDLICQQTLWGHNPQHSPSWASTNKKARWSILVQQLFSAWVINSHIDGRLVMSSHDLKTHFLILMEKLMKTERTNVPLWLSNPKSGGRNVEIEKKALGWVGR